MPTERLRYIDPDATGTGTGLSLANAYVSQMAATVGEIGDPDLVANDEILAFECYSTGGTADTGGTPAIPTTWITDATRYIEFRAGAGNEASTEWDATKYRLQTTTNSPSIFRGIKVRNLQVDAVHTGSQLLYNNRANDIEYTGNYFRYSGSGGSANYAQGWSTTTTGIVFVNNIVDGFPEWGIANTRATDASSIYNNTFISCGIGIRYDNATAALVKNNIFEGCTTDLTGTYAAGADANATDNASLNYTVTGGGNTGDRLSQTFTFASATDFAITGADAGARTFGLDLTADASYPFADDIDGNVRGATWDIGAFQVTAGALAPTITSVDGDNIITNGQTGIIILGANFESAQGAGGEAQ